MVTKISMFVEVQNVHYGKIVIGIRKYIHQNSRQVTGRHLGKKAHMPRILRNYIIIIIIIIIIIWNFLSVQYKVPQFKLIHLCTRRHLAQEGPCAENVEKLHYYYYYYYLDFFISAIQSSTIQTYSIMFSFYSLTVVYSFQYVFYVTVLLMFCHLNCHWLLRQHVY